MKIALATDHAGFRLKEAIKGFLQQEKIECQDFGAHNEQASDFIDFGAKAIQEVVKGNCDRGILICGTGLGMSIMANKFAGIRATPCYDLYAARMSRKHNDSNVLVLAGRMTGEALAREITKVWLETGFEKGRHERRFNKLKKLEKENFK